jgi:hypothetical protein
MGEKRNKHRGFFFVGKLEERDHLEKLRVHCRISNCTLNLGWRDVIRLSIGAFVTTARKLRTPQTTKHFLAR